MGIRTEDCISCGQCVEACEIGLTVENAIKAGKLLREYDRRKSQNVI
jgi:ferredoxin